MLWKIYSLYIETIFIGIELSVQPHFSLGLQIACRAFYTYLLTAVDSRESTNSTCLTVVEAVV